MLATGRRLNRIVVLISILAMSSAIGAGVLAQGGPPPPDATPGAVGFQGAVLAAIDPVLTPGYRLALAESVFAPGAYVTSHFHPTAIVVCVQEGALGFAIQHGRATTSRAAGPNTPQPTETLAVDMETVLQPHGCVAFDQFAAHTSHTGWNASDGETVLWEARLLKIDEPFTTFIDAQGTPVP